MTVDANLRPSTPMSELVAAVSWGPDRLDIFAVGDGQEMWHKAWLAGEAKWWPSERTWQPLGGKFIEPTI